MIMKVYSKKEMNIYKTINFRPLSKPRPVALWASMGTTSELHV